jgi:hypothetical protein
LEVQDNIEQSAGITFHLKWIKFSQFVSWIKIMISIVNRGSQKIAVHSNSSTQ